MNYTEFISLAIDDANQLIDKTLWRLLQHLKIQFLKLPVILSVAHLVVMNTKPRRICRVTFNLHMAAWISPSPHSVLKTLHIHLFCLLHLPLKICMTVPTKNEKKKKNDGSASQSFNCTMCDLSYTLKNNLRRHVRNKH